MTWTIDQALTHWQEKKLLTKKKADELRASLPDHGEHMQARAIGIFTAIGAILVGLGVVLFVSSNWDVIPAAARVGMLLLATVVSGVVGYVLAYEKKTYVKTGNGLLFLNILLYGATIFLIAQIYHLPLDYWQGMLLWFLGTAYFAYALQSRMHAWLAVPLLVVTLGWLRSSMGGTGGELGFLTDERVSVFPLLGFLGLGILSASLLYARVSWKRFASATLFHWGLFLVLFLLVLTTADKSLFFLFLRYPFDDVGIGILIGSLLLTIIGLVFGSFQSAQGRAGVVAMTLYLCFITVLAYLPVWMGALPASLSQYVSMDVLPPMFTWLFVLHIVLVFVFALCVIWFGSLLRRPAVINLGMIAFGMAIVIQYFSWAFDLLPRSFAFILGGAIILVLGTVLENQRRRLIRSTVPA